MSEHIRWRVSRAVKNHLYEGVRFICQCPTDADAKRIVDAVNAVDAVDAVNALAAERERSAKLWEMADAMAVGIENLTNPGDVSMHVAVRNYREWQKSQAIPRCLARHPEEGQCVMRRDHKGQHIAGSILWSTLCAEKEA